MGFYKKCPFVSQTNNEIYRESERYLARFIFTISQYSKGLRASNANQPTKPKLQAVLTIRRMVGWGCVNS